MRISLLAVGRRMPPWVDAGFDDYARRLLGPVRLTLVEVEPARRAATEPASRVIDEEGRRLLARVPPDAHVVALDERGAGWSSRELALRLAAWMQERPVVALLVGGADGLSESCLATAGERWSLSALTLPHGLVRVVVAEQIYRAAMLVAGHPYHRD